jgi:hypothetical protein
MKNIIKIFMLLLIASGWQSCATQKRCNKKYPPQVITSDSVITNTITIYRDTTIYVYLPGDTVRDTIEVVVKEGIANSRPSIHETDLSWSKAQVVDGRLIHELIQKDSVLARVIDNAIRESAIITDRTRIETKIIEKNFVSSWQWFQIWLGRLFGLLLLLFLGYFYVRYVARTP